MKNDESNYPTRDKLVRNLRPDEAGGLLVHSHIISPERRRALLFWRGPADVYFNAAQQEEIKQWIAKEDYLPQSDPVEHPKRPTRWCGYCGQVEDCEHLDKQDRKTLQDCAITVNKKIKLMTIVLALPEKAGEGDVCDLLSNLRDDNPGSIIEWAKAKPVKTTRITKNVEELFESTRISS